MYIQFPMKTLSSNIVIFYFKLIVMRGILNVPVTLQVLTAWAPNPMVVVFMIFNQSAQLLPPPHLGLRLLQPPAEDPHSEDPEVEEGLLSEVIHRYYCSINW